MAMEASEIARLIKEAIPDAEVVIEDLRGQALSTRTVRPIRAAAMTSTCMRKATR